MFSPSLRRLACIAFAIAGSFDASGTPTTRPTSVSGAAFLAVPLDIDAVALGDRRERKRRRPILASLCASSTDDSPSAVRTVQKQTGDGVRIRGGADRANTPRAVAISTLVAADLGDDMQPHIRKQFSLKKLDTHPGYLAMEHPRDRSLTRYLVALVERRQGQIDKVLSVCANRWPPKNGKHIPLLVACLRVAVAEILFKKTPNYAATKETIGVLRAFGKNVPEPMIKFANAVLRRVGRTGLELLETETSVLDNVAPWLLDEWKQTYGEENTLGIVDQFMKEPPFELSINHAAFLGMTPQQRETEIQGLCEELGENVVVLPQGSLHLGNQRKGTPSLWPQYKNGTWWVQSASSTLPALALTSAIRKLDAAKAAGLSEQEVLFGDQSFFDQGVANAVDCDLSLHHVVDMCASPGGKTCQLLSMGFGHVTAVEADPRRVGKLVANLKRLSLRDRCSVVISDGRTWTPESPSINSMKDEAADEGLVGERQNERGLRDWVRQDILEGNPQNVSATISGILLDVPCSATGVGGRRPDVLRRPKDLGNLLSTQEELLHHCVDNLLEPGGVLVYSTCSLLRSESEDQILNLISRSNEKQQDGEGAGETKQNKRATMKILPIRPEEIPGFEKAIDDHGFLRVVPGMLDGPLSRSDGFFVARLLRVA